MNEVFADLDFSIDDSIDENTGFANVEIDGIQFSLPRNCDDPIIELFRPIRVKHRDDMLFSISVLKPSNDKKTVCLIMPSNRHDRPTEEFLEIAINNLRGEKGIINEYKALLELFFIEDNGLKLFLENLEAGKIKECNAGIKEFAKSLGMEIPSRKKKPAKTKAQKKADGIAYLEAHPELLNR